MSTPQQPTTLSGVVGRLASGTGEPRRILIVAGGTGGHIAPALAVGECLRRRFGERVLVRYLTGSRAIERKSFDAAGEFPETLACDTPPRVSVFAMPQMARYGCSVWESARILRRFRPDAILAMGGYVCAPVLMAARAMRIPFYLHESNAVPGRVTRLFASRAARVFVAHEGAARHLAGKSDTWAVGTPVREELHGVPRDEGRAAFEIIGEGPVLLVLGGSQGAQAINEAMLEALPQLARSNPGLSVIWACGPVNLKTCLDQVAALSELGVAVRLFDFIDDMQMAYAAADLVISRAGASTLAEITALGLPAILIPYPHAKDNHQHENARALAEQGGAEVLDETHLNSDALCERVVRLLRSSNEREAMAAAARRMATPHSSEMISLELMNQSGSGGSPPVGLGNTPASA